VLAGEKKSNGKKNEPNSEFDNFQRLLKDTLAVPKEELDKRRDEHEQAQKRRKKDAP
jgi:hypothetical protein